MITRRTLVLTGMTAPLAGLLSQPALAAPPAPSDPVAIVNAIYTRVIKGKGDGGGGFVTENKAAKAVMSCADNVAAKRSTNELVMACPSVSAGRTNTAAPATKVLVRNNRRSISLPPGPFGGM